MTTRSDLRAALGGRRAGLVPTLGDLHAGHASLIERSVEENATTVVSVFVNPTQFDDPADAARYPRDLERDVAIASAAGAEVVFTPSVFELYPPGFATSIEVDDIGERWEGSSRPGHFRGVATVVTLLLNLVMPDRSYFGEKDLQQLAVVRRLHADLVLSGEIVGCPTVRDANGLAISSRNARLSAPARERATALPASLLRMAAAATAGERDPTRLTALGRALLESVPEIDLDYLAVVDCATMKPVGTVGAGDRAIVAARLDGVRLIDNILLDETFDERPALPPVRSGSEPRSLDDNE